MNSKFLSTALRPFKRRGSYRTVLPVALIAFCALLSSCTSGTLVTSSVAYQSIRTTFRQPTEIPGEAEISVVYAFSIDGKIIPVVANLTSEIMIIDQTMSFFVNTDGKSTSYYDPTVRTTTQTDMASSTKGGSVNLGAINDVLGIGGVFGSVLGRINVGGSGTTGTSVSNTTYFADQPRISLAPHSYGAMSKNFSVTGVGSDAMNISTKVNRVSTPDNSSCRFSVCISYSLDGGKTFKKIVTNFYENARVVVPVAQYGRVNNALRQLYQEKPDAVNEPCWMLFSNSNVPGDKTYQQGTLVDYQ